MRKKKKYDVKATSEGLHRHALPCKEGHIVMIPSIPWKAMFGALCSPHMHAIIMLCPFWFKVFNSDSFHPEWLIYLIPIQKTKQIRISFILLSYVLEIFPKFKPFRSSSIPIIPIQRFRLSLVSSSRLDHINSTHKFYLYLKFKLHNFKLIYIWIWVEFI